MQVEALDHLHIYSADPDASVAFYCDRFGADLAGQLPGSDGRQLNLVRLGGQLIAIADFPQGMQAGTPAPAGDGALTHGFGVAHFGLRVDDLAGAIEELRAAGVAIHGEPAETSGIRYAYVGAPDGVVLELTQYG